MRFKWFLICSFATQAYAQTHCFLKNKTTQHGEKLTYKVYYTLAGAYINAGEAVFSNQLENWQNKTIYHLKGVGRTYSHYDWFFKVRDVYESFVDTATMQSFKFVRDVHEGSTRKYEHIMFNHKELRATTSNGLFTISPCTQDVLSMIYFARNIDYSKYKAGDKIPYTLFIDDEVFHLYIKYVGTKQIKTPLGSFQTIVIKPLLVKGTIFSGGENMTVYVSQDKHKLPLLIETSILVGKIKVYLTHTEGLKP
ncbi:MAG: DUF3108 domain-containing protein [Chitinophagaceae bacterium]